jgi:hypothetical protein
MLPCWLTGCSKRLLAAWEAARKRGEDEEENECGRRAKRDGSLPRDHACRRQQSCPAESSARPRLRPSAAYLSPTGVANSKACCHLSNASLRRNKPGRDVLRPWRLPRLKGDTRERSRSPRTGLGITSGAARLDIGSLIGRHVRNGS